MGLWERISGLAGGIRERIKGLGARAGEFVRAYRIPVTLILGGTLVLLVLIILGVVLGNGWLGAGRAGSGALSGANVYGPAAEDLFLPEEPDFLPELLPGREQRESWTVQDALPYWQDPRKLPLDEKVLEDIITGTIDGLMERVP